MEEKGRLPEMFAAALLEQGDPLSFIAHMVDTMYEAIVVHQAGTIQFVNSAAAKIIGAETRTSLLGADLMEFIHPDDRPKAEQRIGELLAGVRDRVETEVYRLIRTDGTVIFAEVRSLKLSGATPARILVVARDVTKERQHRREMDRLQMMVDQAVDPIYATDTEGRFTLINQAAEQLLKLPRTQLIGHSFEPFIAPEHLEFVRREFQQKIGGRKLSSAYEMVIIDHKGERHPMENNSSLIRDDTGNPIGIQGVLRDLSRRKRNEERIRMLTQVMEHVDESIFVTDREGLVCYANRGSGQLFGRKPHQMLGCYAAELRGGHRDDARYREIVARLNSGKQWREILKLPAPDGSVRQLARVISPIPDDQGNTRYHACVDRDITEQIQQRTQLEHTQRLESLGVLAGGIAHDFNNILTAIIGNASLADRQLRHNPAAARSHLIRIGQSAERAAMLCRQMLAYSGRGQFVVKRLDLSQEVRTMSALLEVSLRKQVRLNMDLADNLPLIEVDESQLQQLVMNLITNANEAITGEGRITLRTGVREADADWLKRCVAVDEIRPGRYIFLEVEDNGCGMDAATQEKVFDPFFTTKFTGRGLGMSALLGIVRGHDGYIHLDSEPGRGTCFTVLLPIAPEKKESDNARPVETTSATSPSSAPADKPITVLVVEDEPVVREAAVAMLEDAGFTVLEARDGEAGVTSYRKQHEKVDVVLLDLTMPRMDGDEALNVLQEIDPSVRVIICSGYTDSEVRDRFIDRGIAGILRKPYDQGQLCDAVRRAVTGDN